MISFKRASILGGNGYIGTSLIPLLKDAFPGCTIGSFSRTGRGLIDAVEYRKVDINNEKEIETICNESDLVINLVGILEESKVQTYDNIHRKAPSIISSVMSRKPNSLFVHLSALGADENSKIPYARSKGKGEVEIRKNYINSKGSCVIVRPGLVIGKNDNFLNRFSLLTKYLPLFPIFGDGKSKFQPIVLEDLSRIIVNTCRLDPSCYEQVITVEVGGRNIHEFKDIVYKCTRKPGLPAWLRWAVPPYLFPLPVPLALIQAALIEAITSADNPLRLTRNQVKQLQFDNIVTQKHPDNVQTIHILEERAVADKKITALLSTDVQFNSIDDVFFAGKYLKQQ